MHIWLSSPAAPCSLTIVALQKRPALLPLPCRQVQRNHVQDLGAGPAAVVHLPADDDEPVAPRAHLVAVTGDVQLRLHGRVQDALRVPERAQLQGLDPAPQQGHVWVVGIQTSAVVRHVPDDR